MIGWYAPTNRVTAIIRRSGLDIPRVRQAKAIPFSALSRTHGREQALINVGSIGNDSSADLLHLPANHGD